MDRERLLSAARRRLPTAHVADLTAGAAGRAVESLSELLGEAAGVRILQYGGLGAFSTVSLRGAPPGQVAIHLDGVPVTSAAHGVVDLADLPVTAVERVEVYRSVAPLAWGAAAPGGAINLVTRTAASGSEVRISQGSFLTTEVRASAGLERGPAAGLVHAGYQGSDGDFRFRDDNATEFEPGDDRIGVRVNNRFDARTALGSVTVRLPARVAATLRADHFGKAQGLPGRGANPAREARLGLERAVGRLELAREASRAWPALRAGAALGRERLELEVTEDHLGIGRHRTRDEFRDRRVSAALEWPRLPLGFALEGGVSRRDERADLHDAAAAVPDPPPSTRATNGVHGALRWGAWDDRVLLHAAGRRDEVRDRLRWSTGFAAAASEARRALETPQLGARLVLPLRVELRANWTRARRAPDFMELFGNQGATQGNPALRAETAENRDAGLSWSAAARGASLAAEWARFDHRARDLVVFVRNSPNSVKATNVSRARIRGDELSLRLEAPRGLALGFAGTWQRARDTGDVGFWAGKRLPQRPARQWHARLAWSGARLRVAAEALHSGATFLDRYNRHRVPARTLVGASLSISPTRELRLVVEGKNLGDRRVFDVGGYPLPGRSVWVALQARGGSPPAP